ncbi:3-keto-L-gulonate-6-phosphate decarboxylase UlaD [Gallibacterium trehalosifermentans]|uniref:3-keto-L-gulonate-6-phosphate decarboxylase UlaD n=1 Tax=Gallibacterium trehalosifermentans TaxID=516935 RepID=A0ABV6GZY3_9PAST
MTKPLLQLALDCQDMDTAIQSIERVKDQIDIIEVGTILAFAQGMNAVKTLSERYPNHIIVCDMKATDAGSVLAKMAFEAGANWITVSAAAHIATIEASKKIADQCGGEIQIELYGHWTYEDAKQWVDLGIKQAIYHRPRDAELAGIGWTEADFEKIKKLSALGLQLSITGGITPESLSLFTPFSVKAFIAGRGLTGESGQEMAISFQQSIKNNW